MSDFTRAQLRCLNAAMTLYECEMDNDGDVGLSPMRPDVIKRTRARVHELLAESTPREKELH